MKNKTTIILAIVLVLLVGAYFAFIHKWHGPDNEFHIEDTQLVGAVDIEKVEMNEVKEKVSLSLDGKQWKVDGKYNASTERMQDFLLTLQQIRAISAVEPKAQGSALSLLKRNHIHVHVKDHDGSTLKEYLIGATNSDQTANIFKMSYSDQCYLVSKPALDGYVSIFYSTRLLDWREKLLWNIPSAELQSIAISYQPDSMGYSYKLERDHDRWFLPGNQPAHPQRAEGYASLFNGKVFAESFADLAFPGLIDSLLKVTPNVTITAQGKDPQPIILKLFLRPGNQENYFAYLEPQHELLTVQHFVIDKYLKTKSYFIDGPQDISFTIPKATPGDGG